MSHFVAVALLPGNTKESEFEKKIGKLLAPFDENKRVPKHLVPCHCIGGKAQEDASKAADAKHGTIEEMRKKFWADRKGKDRIPYPDTSSTKEQRKAFRKQERDDERAWQKLIGPHQRTEKKTFEAHPDRKKPDPKCDDCKGKGKRSTTYNPKSKWDWWVIGGRWPDFFNYGKYDPYTDPDNLETCWLCAGTGKRNDKLGQEERAKNPAYTCNGCNGKGKSLKFKLKPTHVACPVSSILKRWKSKPKYPFAMITPKGKWLEKGEMGWFACVSNEKQQKVWRNIVLHTFEKYPDHIAVAVDLHI